MAPTIFLIIISLTTGAAYHVEFRNAEACLGAQTALRAFTPPAVVTICAPNTK